MLLLCIDRLYRVCSLLGKKGYMADVTRHGRDVPEGVMETVIHRAFRVLKREGVELGSLDVAPLTGLEENSTSLAGRPLCFVYEHPGGCYGFRDLSRAKEKHSPTQWPPFYYVYLPMIPTPEMSYATIRIQNPQEVWD